MNKLGISLDFVHPEFYCFGAYQTKESLVATAYDLIKEGSDDQKYLGNFIMEWFDNNSYVLLKTSGTTSEPKTIKMQKNALLRSAMASIEYFDLLPGQSALLCLSCKHIAGKMFFLRAILAGLTLEIINPTANPLADINKKYHFSAMVPMQAHLSLNKLNLIETLIIGGAAISESLKNNLLKTKSKIFETYGMTETATHIAIKKLGQNHFKTLPNISVSASNDACLIINAPYLEPNLLTTDVVNLISDSEFEFLGRAVNVINSGGVKLFAEIIEQKLLDFIQNPFYITHQEDELLGQKVVLMIESEPYSLPENTFKSLDKYEIPKEIIFVPNFERTALNKIKRNAPQAVS